MSWNIDKDHEDESVPYAHSSGSTPQEDNVESVVLLSHSNDKATLHENWQQVMLEVIDASSTGKRLGLDLVAILDVSGSMGSKDRLGKMKTAMQFIIKKLGPIDRLSIVTFSTDAKMLCHLRSVTEASQTHLKAHVDGLTAGGGTNIRDGLETGLKVLADRRITGGRVASAFLLSDGDASADATHVDLSVYTFGFGADYDPKVLDEIARKSKGGTFSYVEDGENMSEPFSQILGGLLSVVVQDLKLTVSPQRGDSTTTVEKVDPGLYLQTRDVGSGSVTVTFGDLFAREVRKVIIHIRLPAVNRRKTATAIVAQCSYSIQGKPFFSRKLTVTIRRIGTGSAGSSMVPPEPVTVRTELARRRHAIYLEEARKKVDVGDMDGADKMLVEAKNDLNLEQQSSPIIDILRDTLDKLLVLIRVEGFRAYLRSLKTSHDRQRVAATGRVKDPSRLFETQLTIKFRRQAEVFEKDPTKEPQPVERDFKEHRQQEEEEEKAHKRLTERPPTVVEAKKTWTTWWGYDEHQHRTRSRRAWAMVILCAVLGISVAAAVVAVAVLAVYGHNRTPYMSVSDAQLGALQYAAQDGTIQYLQLSITIVANNVKSKADASFSQVDLALQLHGVDVALLRAPAFVVPPQSSMPLQYSNVVSSGRALDPAGMRSMQESLDAGVVPFDLHGKVRTRWKGGGFFHRAHFWTRISCRLRFFFPGNGTVMPADRRRCRSRSP